MKRVLWAIFLLAVLAACWVAGNRFVLERGNTDVELVYDLRGVLEYSELAEADLSSLLRDLKEAGVHSMGIQAGNVGEWLLDQRRPDEEIMERIPRDPQELARFLGYSLAFEAEELEACAQAGLAVVPKIGVVPWDIEPIWLDYDPHLIIVSGAGAIRREQFYGSQANLALVEFATPKLEEVRPAPMIRLHTVSSGELENLSDERIVNRYVRAVRERNARVLYLRPFVGREENWEESLQLLEMLQEGLSKAGYNLGFAVPFPSWSVPLVLTFLIWAGICSGFVLFAGAWLPRYSRLFLGVAILGWLGVVALSFFRFTLTQQAMALGAAVIFPCFALQARRGKTPLQRYLFIAALSLAGAFLVAATLSGESYLIKLDEFRGVKIMHVVPILLQLLILAWPIKDWLNKNVPVKYLIFAGGLGLLGLLYLRRTGNFGVRVPQIEIIGREFLENILIARPRTKEFLIGHPALYLMLRHQDRPKSWWLPVAVIGQLSLINTFTHIHTPLWLSLLRTFYGLVIGYVLGWVLSRCYLRLKRWFGDGTRLRILRVWQSGR